jgi:LysM repeat protein
MWTKSACAVLASSILLVIVVAAGLIGSARPAQANIRIASSTDVTLTGMPGAAVAPAAARTAARYVVQPGDTLSGIAARFAVRGGWPALYAANRPLIGPNPDLIHPGTVLLLPGLRALARYTVVAGDTLSGIAAALAVPGGWPALYAANRAVIGPDPALIHPGTVLAIPHPASPAPPAPARPSPPRRPSPSPAPVPSPARPEAPATGMPSWLKLVLLAAALLAAAAFAAEPVLILRRRRKARVRSAIPGPSLPSTPVPSVPAGPAAAAPANAPPGTPPGPVTSAAPLVPVGAAEVPRQRVPSAEPASDPDQPRVVLADHDRLVVTRSPCDGIVCVLRPPGEDPKAILKVARLVLPEGSYQALAEHLGLPATWPVILADYDRVVVTCSRDGTVCVLRPPGEDPKAILRAARLVLPEAPYGELADQLGVPASWPLEHRCVGPPG